jgi:hypothetical protein
MQSLTLRCNSGSNEHKHFTNMNKPENFCDTSMNVDYIVTWMVKAVSSRCCAEPSRGGQGHATLVATQRCGKHLSAALPW